MVKEDFSIYLEDAPEGKVFWLSEGGSIKNLVELGKELKKMDEEIFNFHVNSKKNDFAVWIYDVIGDRKLSKDVRDIKDKNEMSKKVKTRVSYIKRKIKKFLDL